jgi:hypothetical protein
MSLAEQTEKMLRHKGSYAITKTIKTVAYIAVGVK